MAEFVADGRVAALGGACMLRTAEHASPRTAWKDFGGRIGRPCPRGGGRGEAGGVQGEVLELTNNLWVIHPAQITAKLGATRYALVNDFGAVAHAVAQIDAGHFLHLRGGDGPMATSGVVSIISPGTGLGVAQLIRRGPSYEVLETEGGHIDVTPLDSLENQILGRFRWRHVHVSVECVLSGMWLANIHEVLADIDARYGEARHERARRRLSRRAGVVDGGAGGRR